MQQKPLDFDTVLYLARNLRTKAREELFASGWDGDVDTLAATLWEQCKGYGYAGLLDGKPVYGGSLVEVFPGAYTFWSLCTEDFPKLMWTVTKFVRRVMLPEIFGKGAWRVEARLVDGDPDTQKWMRLLGARLDSKQLHTGVNGETFLIFVWSKNDVRR